MRRWRALPCGGAALRRLTGGGGGAARAGGPNKGVREQPQMPDRLKDAVQYFGAQTHHITMEQEDAPYRSEEQRRTLTTEVMGMSQNMRNVAKFDRLRAALSAVHTKGPEDDGWGEVYLFLRTSEQSTELVRDAHDAMPKGAKLWINLDECEERRTAHLLQMPNGMVVLPVFSMEEYLDFYFSTLHEFEACWFPVPRMGSRYEPFCALPFPVCAAGSVAKMCALATVAHAAQGQFGILVNPGQRSSKFLTYPEMVLLATTRRVNVTDVDGSAAAAAAGTPAAAASPSLLADEVGKRHAAQELADQRAAASRGAPFHASLRRIFDTRKLPLRRLTAEGLAQALATRPPLPQVAQLELQLLLFDFPSVRYVFVRSVRRPLWRRVLRRGAGVAGGGGGAGMGDDRMTQLDVITEDGRSDAAVVAVLEQWSFMREFRSDVHIQFASEPPLPSPEPPTAAAAASSKNRGAAAAAMPETALCLYTPEDRELFRGMAAYRGVPTMRDLLEFDAPLRDVHGNVIPTDDAALNAKRR